MNEQITASRVQVITESGEQLGILPFSEALGMAREQDLDLVEMAVRDGVVIAKIIDWQKQLFIEKKNKKKNQATAKKTELKTLRLSYAIGEHDMEIRRNQAEKFAKEGHILRIELPLRGREMRFQDMARTKLQSFVDSIAKIYRIDGPIKFMGRRFNIQLHPLTPSSGKQKPTQEAKSV
ncbi:translation initiation factor IF-3 [Candidatus Gracilibacteria bacterium]|nr:translation initiation factor IF-3 [Candidatus Gracilibacteria bacterium]